ncbi:MAG: hypothetical protein ACFB2Y_15855 [Fulvivirga sp.]
MNKYLITIFFFLAGTSVSVGQDCKTQLKQAYQMMADFDITEGFYIDYTAKVVTADTEKTERIKSYGKGSKSVVESKDYRLYQDDSVIVSIIEPNKTIFIARRAKSALVEDQFEKIVTIQDSLLRSAKDVRCISGQTDYGTNQYTIVPNDDLVQRFFISDYIIWTDKKGQMTRSLINYNSGTLKSLEMVIHEYNNFLEKPIFSGTALEMVTAGKSLKERYSTYKLIDSRKPATSNVN